MKVPTGVVLVVDKVGTVFAVGVGGSEQVTGGFVANGIHHRKVLVAETYIGVGA